VPHLNRPADFVALTNTVRDRYVNSKCSTIIRQMFNECAKHYRRAVVGGGDTSHESVVSCVDDLLIVRGEKYMCSEPITQPGH
jgi:predicted HD phosphohydrolase